MGSTSGRNGQLRVLCKGAPEVVEQYLAKVPDNYKENYIGFVKDGARVLSLAYKDLGGSLAQAESMTREEAESDLVFCGFIISECPLKDDTKAVIQELTDSGHECKMITGDNQLTAAYVAHQCGFTPEIPDKKSAFVTEVIPSSQKITWVDIDEKHFAVTSSAEEVRKLSL